MARGDLYLTPRRARRETVECRNSCGKEKGAHPGGERPVLLNQLHLTQLKHCLQDVVGLWEDDVLEHRLIGNKSVLSGDAADRRVQVEEQFVGDAGGDFCAVTPAQHVFVNHEYTAGLLYGRGDRLPVVRAESA